MDTCSGHNEGPEHIEACTNINVKIRKLPANATHVCQQLDSFVIAMVKNAWRSEWEAEKLRRILAGDWADKPNGLRN